MKQLINWKEFAVLFIVIGHILYYKVMAYYWWCPCTSTVGTMAYYVSMTTRAWRETS
ncbi:hypothetical protein ABVC73_16225 [Prevotella melaninogenica]